MEPVYSGMDKMLELNEKKLQLKIYGKELEINFPSVGQIQKFTSKMKEVEDEKHLDLMIEFLACLGLDSEITLSLRVDSILEIMNELTVQKKS